MKGDTNKLGAEKQFPKNVDIELENVFNSKLKKNMAEMFESYIENFNKFIDKSYSNYKNHKLNTKIYYFFLTNATINIFLGIIYMRNRCYFKFSPMMYRKYLISYGVTSGLILLNTIFIMFSKAHRIEYFKRYNFVFKRNFTGEWRYLEEKD